MSGEQKWSSAHSAGALAIVLAIPIVVTSTAFAEHTLLTWLTSLFFLICFLLLTGHGVTGMWRGAFIDDRNVISLSRFQMVVWTVMVLSAYLAAALCNLAIGNDDPLQISIPAQLWILMGISTTSLVGSPLILSTKKTKEPAEDEKRTVFELLSQQGDSNETLGNKGLVVTNTTPEKARWSDMFTGEETGNAAHLDLSRIQMFFFTLIVALAYSIALANMFIQSGSNGIATMPSLDESMLSLIAISHGGYLVAKGIPNSQQEPPNKPATPTSQTDSKSKTPGE